jgi:hypothetical protein
VVDIAAEPVADKPELDMQAQTVVLPAVRRKTSKIGYRRRFVRRIVDKLSSSNTPKYW